MNVAKQREAWLNRAATIMRKAWVKRGVEVPVDVQLSCGFPGGGSPRRRIGECWPRSRSERKVNQVFVSPILGNPVEALDVLGHELLHSVDDCKSKHGYAFSKSSRLVGYSGGKQSGVESVDARKLVARIIKKLGAYPHGAVILAPKKQKASNGLHKYECPDDGDVLYTTEKKVDEFDVPCCRACGEPMQASARKPKKIVTTI